MEDSASEEERVIAGVLLAGWHIDDWTLGWGNNGIDNRYRLWSPQGRIIGHYATKYTAALAAETWMTGSVRVELKGADYRHGNKGAAEMPDAAKV